MKTLDRQTSKVGFHLKFGGPRRARRFKRLLRLAYGLCHIVASLGALCSASLAAQARICRRSLDELAGM